MERFDHILFPVDFSDRCFAAGPAVAAMARRFRAQVTLLHVLNMPPGAYQDWYAYLNLVDRQSMQAEIERGLHRFLVEQFSGVDARRVLADGEPAAAIAKFAADQAVDLVMLPTRGHGRFRSVLLGSVTAKVLHDCNVPVWTEAHLEEAAPPLEYRSVACAVDLTSRTPGVLRWGRRMAEAFGARLTAIYADDDGTQASATQAEELFAGYARDAGVEIGLDVAPGSPSDALLDAVSTRGADLLVMGRGESRERLGRLRTHSMQIVGHAGCPVLSV